MNFQKAFYDELEKVAASIRQLEEAFTRIGVKTPRKGSVADIFKALTIPTKRQAKAVQKIGKEPEWQAAVPPMIRRSIEGYMRRSPGKIYVSKDAGKAFKPSATKQEVKDLRTLFGVHEGLERRVKPREIEYSSLHLSPKVMMEEKNLLSKLTGAESSKKYLEGLRVAGGEYPLLRRQFDQAFGKRALPFLQEGSRIPRAMKKRFMRIGGRGELGASEAQEMIKGQGGYILADAIKSQLGNAHKVKL